MKTNSRHVGWIALGILLLLLVGNRAEATESQVALTQGTGFDADPVALQGLTAFDAWLEIYVIDELQEKMIAQDVRHRKITVTWGVTDDGILERVVLNETGWTKTVLSANKMVMEKDGPNQNMALVICPQGEFLTVGLGKPVKIEAEITFTDDTVIAKTLDTEVDVFDLAKITDPVTIQNAKVANGVAGPWVPFHLLPYEWNVFPDGVDITGDIDNSDIALGEVFPLFVIPSKAIELSPGYPDRFNDAGNRHALEGGNLIITAQDAIGQKRLVEISVQVANAIPKLLDDSIPPTFSYGQVAFYVTAGDPETSVSIQIEMDAAALIAIVEFVCNVLHLDPDPYLNELPSIEVNGPPTVNADGSVTQGATLTVPYIFYGLVYLSSGIIDWIVTGDVTIRPTDDGDSLVVPFTIHLEP